MAYTKEMRAEKAKALGATPPAPTEARTVRMVRLPDTNPPPYSADVHPDEVASYAKHGWRLSEVTT